LARQHSGAGHSPDWSMRLFAPDPPCFSLFSSLFSLLRGGSGFAYPPKTVCFQMVEEKASLCAKQGRNREIIRAYQGGKGRQQAKNRRGRFDRFKRDSAPFRRNSAARNVVASNPPTRLDRRASPGSLRSASRARPGRSARHRCELFPQPSPASEVRRDRNWLDSFAASIVRL
jgi:hypothetical protein